MSRSSLRRSGRARVNKGLRSVTCHPYVHPKWIVSDIAVFVLKRDVKLQPTNHHPKWWNKPAFTPRPQNVTSLWLVLIFCLIEGRRLSWLGWLGEIPRWFIRPKTVTHPRVGGESNSWPLSRKSDALTRRQSHRKQHSSQLILQVRSLVTN